MALVAPTAATPPPPPGNVAGLLSWTDYPPSALDKGEQGPVYVQLIVNPEGRVDSCSVLLSNGYGDLDLATCNIVKKRARFSPAYDETGRPIYSTYRQVITWRIAGNYSLAVPPAPEMPPDFDLTLNQTPPGVKLPMRFNISYFIKANGTTSHCQGFDAGKPPPQMLVDLACKAVLQSPVQVIRNHNNEPVDANCQTVVRFSVDRNKR